MNTIIQFFPSIPTDNLMLVKFNNISMIPFDATFAWDFGDGDTSTEEEPSHDFSVKHPKGGIFEISLTVGYDSMVDPGDTGLTHTETPVTMTLGLSPNHGIIPSTSIVSFVLQNLPEQVQVTNNYIETLITKWRFQLAEGADIPFADIHNPFKWSFLYQQLISQLVLLDILFAKANSYLLSLAGTSASAGGSSKLSLKYIETGPSKAEWFQASADWYNLMKPGGLYETTLGLVCNLAGYLTIYFPFCGRMPKVVLPPEIITFDTEHNQIERTLYGTNKFPGLG